jgi:streptomycin 6-kinase
MRELRLPAAFTSRVNDVHGERGRKWLNSLPVLIDQYAVRWSLSTGPPIGDLSYNWVAPARRIDGTEVVLKLGVPHREFSSEVEALRVFDGKSAVRVIDADPEQGAMLLERADPGAPLWGVDDERAAPIVAGVMKALWRPVPAAHQFPTLADWAGGFDRLRSRFDGDTSPLPTQMVEKAERTFRELDSAAQPVVLHGDLHHGNILTARRSPYLAIDPKGVVGAPVYEVGAFVRNGVVLASPHPASVLRRRIEILSEHLGFERPHIRDAAFAVTVLSAWWSVEDHGSGWEETIRIARYLDELQV